MADIGPKIEMKALRDNFATAKQDDPRVRCSLALAFDHLSKSLEEAKAFDRMRHHGIVGRISEGFLAVRQGFQVMANTREPILHPIPILSLHPTQMTVGMREVKEKRKRWRFCQGHHALQRIPVGGFSAPKLVAQERGSQFRKVPRKSAGFGEEQGRGLSAGLVRTGVRRLRMVKPAVYPPA